MLSVQLMVRQLVWLIKRLQSELQKNKRQQRPRDWKVRESLRMGKKMVHGHFMIKKESKKTLF